jgi:hypothetical protein
MRLTAGQQFRQDHSRPVGRGRGESKDRFFTASKCGRCGGDLSARTMSWFTTETICADCAAKEQDIKRALRAKGIDDAMEGCGYIPKV